jgi:hypothetical protein
MRFIGGESFKEAIARFHNDASLKKEPGRRSLEVRKGMLGGIYGRRKP